MLFCVSDFDYVQRTVMKALQHEITIIAMHTNLDNAQDGVNYKMAEKIGFPGVTRELDGGAGVLLELPVDSSKELSHLTVEAVSNEVVIGLMGVTIQR